MACPKGTYKETSGTFPCVGCSEGMSTRQEGSSSPEDCVPLCKPVSLFIPPSPTPNLPNPKNIQCLNDAIACWFSMTASPRDFSWLSHCETLVFVALFLAFISQSEIFSGLRYRSVNPFCHHFRNSMQGSSSVDGFEPCTLCAEGTYQKDVSGLLP